MAWPIPALDVTNELAPFAVVALAMVAVTVLVLGLVRPRDGRPPLVTQALLALAVVCGGSVLLLALLFVFLDPNGTTAWTWVLLGFNFMMTVPVGLWFVGHILFEDRRIVGGSWLWPAAIGVAATGSEILMGLLFVVGGVGGNIGVNAAFTRGLSSVWFFWSMAAIMTPLVAWAPLSPVGKIGGWSLVVAATIGPWVRPYPLVGGLAMGSLMVGALVALWRPIARGRASLTDSTLLLALSVAFLAMSATGFSVAATGGASAGVLAFGTTMALVMVVEVSYLLRRTYEAPALLPGTAVAAGRDEPAAVRGEPVAGP